MPKTHARHEAVGGLGTTSTWLVWMRGSTPRMTEYALQSTSATTHAANHQHVMPGLDPGIQSGFVQLTAIRLCPPLCQRSLLKDRAAGLRQRADQPSDVTISR